MHVRTCSLASGFGAKNGLTQILEDRSDVRLVMSQLRSVVLRASAYLQLGCIAGVQRASNNSQ